MMCFCIVVQDWAVLPVTGSTDALVKCFQLLKPDGQCLHTDTHASQGLALDLFRDTLSMRPWYRRGEGDRAGGGFGLGGGASHRRDRRVGVGRHSTIDSVPQAPLSGC